MSDKITQISQDDALLAGFFKNFETILPAKRSEVNWSVAADFQFLSKFLLRDIKEIRRKLKNADEEYLYYVCRHTFNLIDWISLMTGNGFTTLGEALGLIFQENFGDKNALQNTYDVCFEKWVHQKNGQYQVGENFYNILNGKLYYRNHFGQWFEVERRTAFDLQPNKEPISDNSLMETLNGQYKETWYDKIIRQWKDKKYQGTLSNDFLRFDKEETSPEEYFDFTVENIKTLLHNPVSVAELERWSGGEIVELNHIVKICAGILEIVKKRRKDDSHTIYLLRDCLMFYEANKTIDIIHSENTSADQLLVGRKLLNHDLRQWGYYSATLEALYTAYQRYPQNFTEFYNEYARLLDLFVSLHSGFATIVKNIADYIRKHIKTDKKKIVIFDIGFQGSINLLIKYIIDRHIKPSGPNGPLETDIKIGVGAEWSKELFGDRYESDCFPFLNRVQLMARSDELFHYKDGSLDSGKLRVVMGNKEWQHRAAIELVVLVMVTLLAHTDREE